MYIHIFKEKIYVNKLRYPSGRCPSTMVQSISGVRAGRQRGVNGAVGASSIPREDIHLAAIKRTIWKAGVDGSRSGLNSKARVVG